MNLIARELDRTRGTLDETRKELKKTQEIAAMRLERAGWHHALINKLESRVHALEVQVRELGGTPIEPRQDRKP